MSRIGVMHMLDALKIGGAEHVAIDLVNLLPRERYAPFLCTTRSDGPFANLVGQDVVRLCLRRRNRFDTASVARLVRFIRENHIQIIHAHGSSLFFAGLASLFLQHPVVIWHDHYGRYTFDDRPAWLYRAAAKRVAGVIAVNRPLAEWSEHVLHVPANRVWYIPNLIRPPANDGQVPEVPGTPGARIICLANIRPQKDHFNLLKATALLKAEVPQVHVLLVGDAADPSYRDSVLHEIAALGLERNVTHLGPRQDVAALLRVCDVGVLSSASEGLPLALLEYGISGIPAVATDVGQCSEVLENGAAGLLVPPSNPEALADALHRLICCPQDRASFASRLRQRVESLHSPESVIGRVCDVYASVLERVAYRN